MGLLDDVAKLAGGAGGGQPDNSALLGSVVQMLGSGDAGGLASLVQGFQKAGLGDIVGSWVGTGANLPVSPDQLQQGLGADRLQQLARAAGLSEGAAASALSGLLPTVVDKLTPGGTLPQAGQLPQLLGAVRAMLGV